MTGLVSKAGRAMGQGQNQPEISLTLLQRILASHLQVQPQEAESCKFQQA
jgi:hypothetical protein